MVLSVTQTGENRRHREFQLLFGIYEEPVANLVFKSSIFELVCINNFYTKIYTCKVSWNFKNAYLSFYITSYFHIYLKSLWTLTPIIFNDPQGFGLLFHPRVFVFSKIQLVVYYQCCVLIG